MGNESKNEKARKYAGQLTSIKRKSMTLSVTDKLSHVDDSADATYLELLHPAAVYRISILGDIEKGISVNANIRPDHIKRIWMRIKFAEKMLFDRELGVTTDKNPISGSSDEITKTAAFTVTFSMGKLKGKSPASVICEASDKEKAVNELKAQYQFLEQNVSKFKKNQEIMDAISMALEYHDLGLLDNDSVIQAASGEEDLSTEIKIYDPPEKTFRKETKKLQDGRILTRCYKITIVFIPSGKYPYKIDIMNCYAEIVKNQETKLEVIKHVESAVADFNEYRMFLTSDEMIGIIGAMIDNKAYYENAIYSGMRKIDQRIQEENRKAWKPKQQ